VTFWAYGVLVDGKGMDFTFPGCPFSRTTTGPGIGVKEDNDANVDVQSLGRIFLAKCQLSESQIDVGLKVKDAGRRIEARKQLVSKEKQSLVFFEVCTSATIMADDLSECDPFRICIRAERDSEFTNNIIHDLEKVGVQIESGTPSIMENKILNCKTYGIQIIAIQDHITKSDSVADLTNVVI
jgi:hypothetical protein